MFTEACSNYDPHVIDEVKTVRTIYAKHHVPKDVYCVGRNGSRDGIISEK